MARPINYVVEATEINHLSDTELDPNWNERIALDALDQIRSPDFFLLVETEGELTGTPKRNDLRKPFERLAKEADYDRVLATVELHSHWQGNLPSASFQHGEWRINGHLLPVSPSRRRNRRRFVVGPTKVGFTNATCKIKKRLQEKADRYKDVNNLIIALRGDWNLERDEVAEALFGRRALAVPVPCDPRGFADLPPPRSFQKLDEFWLDSSGAKNRNVIGVLMLTSLYPHNVDQAGATFFGNPYLDIEFPAWATEITHAEYRDGEVRYVSGVSPGKFAIDHEPWREAWELERSQEWD